jgi:sec-independent protein translocase protein TatB
MFDLGFSELIVIGIVLLVVVGPERLPGVARTAGHLLGRFQRYVAGVKVDIQREMQLDELKKLQQQARDFNQTLRAEASEIEQGVREALTFNTPALPEASAEVDAEVSSAMLGVTEDVAATEDEDAPPVVPDSQLRLDFDAEPPPVTSAAPPEEKA